MRDEFHMKQLDFEPELKKPFVFRMTEVGRYETPRTYFMGTTDLLVPHLDTRTKPYNAMKMN